MREKKLIHTAIWTLEEFYKMFQVAQTLKTKKSLIDYNPMIECSIEVTCIITEKMFNSLSNKCLMS